MLGIRTTLGRGATAVALLATGMGIIAPARAAATVPALKHVFIIVLENSDYSTSWEAPDRPSYLNGLRDQGVFAKNYYGASHVSAGNYITMTSGQTATAPFNSDCINYQSCVATERARLDGGASIVDQIEDSGRTWGAYMESMGTPCKHPEANTLYLDSYQKGYATRHNPFVYYPPIVDNAARCNSHVVDFSALPPLLSTTDASLAPNYAFIVPDTCSDGHDTPCTTDNHGFGSEGGLITADRWLAAIVPKILASAAYNDRGALFITFDESGFTNLQHDYVNVPGTEYDGGCCTTGTGGLGIDGGGRIGLLMLSPLSAEHGTEITTKYDHSSLVRTIEDGFGIAEHLNNADAPNQHSMTDLFA